jgi:hypothetical protein
LKIYGNLSGEKLICCFWIGIFLFSLVVGLMGGGEFCGLMKGAAAAT